MSLKKHYDISMVYMLLIMYQMDLDHQFLYSKSIQQVGIHQLVYMLPKMNQMEHFDLERYLGLKGNQTTQKNSVFE